jgi:hypothetical protein
MRSYVCLANRNGARCTHPEGHQGHCSFEPCKVRRPVVGWGQFEGRGFVPYALCNGPEGCGRVIFLCEECECRGELADGLCRRCEGDGECRVCTDQYDGDNEGMPADSWAGGFAKNH